jgi:hypothetical protein
MDGLEAIGNLMLGIVQLMVLLSSFIVRGFVWVIAAIANLFNMNLGQRFVNNVVLVIALIITIYLAIGYWSILGQNISSQTMATFFADAIIYPLILINCILWVGYFGAPKVTDEAGRKMAENTGFDYYNLYFLGAIGPIMIVVVSIAFLGAKSDFNKVQRQLERQQKCIDTRTKTAEKLSQLAEKVGIGKSLSEDVGKKLSDRCK